MKITRKQLSQIIRKEVQYLAEAAESYPAGDKEKIRRRVQDPYEYQFKNGKWHARKKGSTSWTDITKYKSSVETLNKEFPDDIKKVQASQPTSPQAKKAETPKNVDPPSGDSSASEEEEVDKEEEVEAQEEPSRIVTVKPAKRVIKTKFKHVNATKWANLARKSGKYGRRMRRKLKRKGIDLFNIEASLKANGGKYESLEEIQKVAEGLGATRKLVTAFGKLFSDDTLENVIPVMSYKEMKDFMIEMATRFPGFGLVLARDGKGYQTPAHAQEPV
jgi:hypothetical protein